MKITLNHIRNAAITLSLVALFGAGIAFSQAAHNAKAPTASVTIQVAEGQETHGFAPMKG